MSSVAGFTCGPPLRPGEALLRGFPAQACETLRVKCPTCAMRWILPRVIRLQNERPELVVEVTAAVSHGVEFNAEHASSATASPASTHSKPFIGLPVTVRRRWRSHS